MPRTFTALNTLLQASVSLEEAVSVLRARREGPDHYSREEFLEARNGIVNARDDLIGLIRDHLAELESTNVSPFLDDGARRMFRRRAAR